MIKSQGCFNDHTCVNRLDANVCYHHSNLWIEGSVAEQGWTRRAYTNRTYTRHIRHPRLSSDQLVPIGRSCASAAPLRRILPAGPGCLSRLSRRWLCGRPLSTSVTLLRRFFPCRVPGGSLAYATPSCICWTLNEAIPPPLILSPPCCLMARQNPR